MSQVRLSIVVPVYNDPEGIERTLSSLVTQDYPEDRYEILVVDNDSTDETPAVIDTFVRENPQLVTYLRETEIRSSYAARNRGIENAGGDYVAFVDADMRVECTWAASVVKKMETDGCRYLGCDVEVYTTEETVMGRYSQICDLPVEEFISEDNFCPTCCLVVAADIFEEVGLFDSRLISGGDIKFGQWVHEADVAQHFAPEITMYHPARTTLKAYVSRNWRIGQGTAQRQELYSHLAEESLWKLFLPPRLKNFFETFGDSWQIKTEAMMWYGFEYLGSVVRGLGWLHERYFSTTPEETRKQFLSD